MHTKINAYLDEIEKEREIKILLACETGSRAWGFPSPDSDYDIRIVYVHTSDWYLSLSEQKDSIELMLENNDLDISGWDIRKSLRLLRKSNAPLLERIQSPIIYRADEQFLTDINALAAKAYSKIATMHHYLNMAKKCFGEVRDEEEYKLKKFFYALRAATACKWIVERDEIPPIDFHIMLKELSIESAVKNRINELIALKATISESYLHSGEQDLMNFIAACIELGGKNAQSLPSSDLASEELDLFFRKTVRRNDH